MHWVVLTDKDTGRPFAVNMEQVIELRPPVDPTLRYRNADRQSTEALNDEGTIIRFVGGHWLLVRESINTILSMC